MCSGKGGGMEFWPYKVRVGKGRLGVRRGGLCWTINCRGNNDMSYVYFVGLYK